MNHNHFRSRRSCRRPYQETGDVCSDLAQHTKLNKTSGNNKKINKKLRCASPASADFQSVCVCARVGALTCYRHYMDLFESP